MDVIRHDSAACRAATRVRNNVLRSSLRNAQSSIAASRRRLLANGILSSVMLLFSSVQSGAQPLKTAIFYGSPVPVDALARYERVVLEADNSPEPPTFPRKSTQVFAYISVGEAEGWRASAKALDEKLFLGTNQGWHSRIADLTQPGWVDYVIEKRMLPLWQRGYRGFFLDTLDSYRRTP
jgi:polysaccharide biosynthesis protein PelA